MLSNPAPPNPDGSGLPRRPSSAPRYKDEERLATGGAGTVYRVVDRLTGEPRALKRLSPESARDKGIVQAFEREYHVLAGLNHPRIIRVYDYGIDEQGPFYTMELVEGRDLRAAAPIPFRQACQYLRDVATSLALLHARRLIHRDVSPRNVRITDDGHCKLLDFGALATFGRTTLVVGTPPAIPPETLDGAPLDQCVDLYSLGALAYWALTGHHAFPAKELEELPVVWKRQPRPPSAYSSDIPEELDDLVLSLLQRDPRARPTSAAEVIARLNVIGSLAPEETSDAESIAESFLLQPRFTGRAAELASLERRLTDMLGSRGSAVTIRAIRGAGRTRLLEELGVRAQLAGAVVLRVDATTATQAHGAIRALVTQLLDALPGPGRAAAPKFRSTLAAFGPEVDRRLDLRSSVRISSIPATATTGTTTGRIEGWFLEVSRARPLVIQVDNVDEADHASLGVVASLAQLTAGARLLVVTTERQSGHREPSLGLAVLHTHVARLDLAGLRGAETEELVRSLFGDAPNAERFASWLHERTTGSPLHALEICRRLVASQVIIHSAGLWSLPVNRPDADLPAALEEALSSRLELLGDAARSLAECLSLQRELPTFALCKSLSAGLEDRQILALLDELARNDVLRAETDGYRFSSSAIREALLHGLDVEREVQHHRRLGEAFAALAGEDDPALTLEAGHHLIRGGRDVEGAELIAHVARESATIRTLMANLNRVGAALEAALLVYRRNRRTPYQCMPLLGALAQAGYYEERAYGERYGDEALSVLEDLSGIRSARRLRRFCGGLPSLVIGILLAFLRYEITPKVERPYTFYEIIVSLLSTATTLAGLASSLLDADRAERVADALAPFAVLPERLTPVGIYQFCRVIQEIGRENEAVAFERIEELRRRFENPKYYPTLPADARRLYIAATHYVRGSFGTFRVDGRSVLESAEALDETGLKLYSMIASQLRFLYRMNRGEFALAEGERRQLELRAAQIGSVWQVETWEAPALILVYTLLSDVVSATRIAHRIEAVGKTVPALRMYANLANDALISTRREGWYATSRAADYASHVPRSYIGWAATMGFLAQAYNDLGEHAEAKLVTERTRSHMTDADRDYCALFLNVDIQHALALDGLGETNAALSILDGLLRRFAEFDHPVANGFLHEARAQITFKAGRIRDYEENLAAAEKWFRGTGNPLLIARYERLAQLGAWSAGNGLAAFTEGVTLAASPLDDAAEATEETKILAG